MLSMTVLTHPEMIPAFRKNRIAFTLFKRFANDFSVCKRSLCSHTTNLQLVCCNFHL